MLWPWAGVQPCCPGGHWVLCHGVPLCGVPFLGQCQGVQAPQQGMFCPTATSSAAREQCVPFCVSLNPNLAAHRVPFGAKISNILLEGKVFLFCFEFFCLWVFLGFFAFVLVFLFLLLLLFGLLFYFNSSHTDSTSRWRFEGHFFLSQKALIYISVAAAYTPHPECPQFPPSPGATQGP